MAEATNPITTASNPRVGDAFMAGVRWHVARPLASEESAFRAAQEFASAPSPEAGAGGDLGELVKRARLAALSEHTLYGNEAGSLYDDLADAIVSLLDHRSGKLVASTGSGKEETKGGWQPIETAPKDGTSFLATHEKSGVRQITWYGKTSHVPLYGWAHGEDVEEIDLWQPTHWMPLPAPPPFPEAALRTLQAAGEVR